MAAGDEQEIGQPIDVFKRGIGDGFAWLIPELHHDALGAPADRAREMQIRRSRVAARQDEGSQRTQTGIEPVDLAFDPDNLGVGDRQPRAARAFFGQAKIGFDIEQIVLDARQRWIERRVIGCVQPHESDRRVDFVECAIGGDAQIVFLAPLAGAKRRRTVVTGAGIDAI